ncbi:MAG: Ala-tRNA(Pro) hydrolase [Thermoflexus sp.]|uniref:alanyl-tRNA editing protein n=1 Tax=Thermoflexus sp. TaxID=1969742 RepID=UPI00332F3AC1
METRLLYPTDAYLRTFEATVVAVEGSAVALDATAFYPGGGGQPPDEGILTDGRQVWVVRAVRRQGPWVWHTVEGEPPAVGQRVRGEIDWERRYALMRTHTALHILCGVVWRDYRAKVTGGNMEPLRGRMDFEFETLTGDRVREIEAKINAEVAAARPVRVYFLPREEADRHPDLIRTKVNLLPPDLQVVRVVEIEGLDLQADGGTHVANTREVGRIRIVDYKSKGKINKRIEIAIEC